MRYSIARDWDTDGHTTQKRLAKLKKLGFKLSEMIGVDDILREVMISRRSLERKFKTILGRSPLDEIRRARVERVKELLTASDMPMPEIAARAGFSGPDRLAVVFKDEVGLAPTDYRKQFRLRG